MRRMSAKFLVCMLALAVGCKKEPESGGNVGGADTGVIKVGEVGSMTGTEATFGTSSDRGIQLAVKEVNGGGGIKGRQIQVIALDDEGKPEEAATAETRLISSEHVIALLGEVASTRSLFMAPKAQQAKVPMVSPSSTNEKVTAVGDYIFRACFIDPFQGYLMARQAREVGIKVPLLGGDGWDSEKLYEIGGAALEGSYFSNHYSVDDPSPRIQEFVAKFKKAYGGQVPDSLAAQAYDAAGMLFDAMKRAKDLTGPSIREALAQTKDYRGVTGDITMDEKRNATKPAVVLRIGKGGKYEFSGRIQPEGVKETNPAEAPRATPDSPKKTEGNTAPNAAPGTIPTPTQTPPVGATTGAQSAANTGQPQGVPAGEHSKK